MPNASISVTKGSTIYLLVEASHLGPFSSGGEGWRGHEVCLAAEPAASVCCSGPHAGAGPGHRLRQLRDVPHPCLPGIPHTVVIHLEILGLKTNQHFPLKTVPLKLEIVCKLKPGPPSVWSEQLSVWMRS